METYREIIEAHLKEIASSNPDKIGMAMSTVGVKKVWSSVDGDRHKRRGTSEAQMRELEERRNAIAHSADWSGSRRRALTVGQVDAHYVNAKEIVEALERVIVQQCPPRRARA